MSLLRAFLDDVGTDEVVVTARRFEAPLVDPVEAGRRWRRDPVAEPRASTVATFDFGGRTGHYDFVDNQW